MWSAAIALVAIVGLAYRICRSTPRPRARGTMVDAMRSESVENLVRMLASRQAGAEGLMSSLEALLHAFPPDEGVLCRLSRMQQAVAGTGNQTEFCVVSVLCVAMHTVMKGRTRDVNSIIRRSQSSPNLWTRNCAGR